MFFINDINNNPLNEYFNPSISITENLKGAEIEYPDPNSYFVLSDAGKQYTIIQNDTILLNINKGYYEPVFSIDINHTSIVKIAMQLFSNTHAIDGDAKRALELAIIKSEKTTTNLKNRY